MSLPSASQPSSRLLLIGGIAMAWVIWGGINVFRLGAVPGLDGRQAFWYGFPDAMIWAALTPLVVAIARRHPIRRDRRFTTLGLHIVAAVAFALLHSLVDTGVAGLRGAIIGSPPDLPAMFFKLLRYGLQMNMLVYTLVAGLALYIEYERRLARGEQRAAALQGQLVEARLEGLERQLRPHFLFNALNTVSGLMGGDAETGRRVVRQIGELLRAGLRGEPGQRIPLRQELELARAYLEIEQARFVDRLQVTIETEVQSPDLRQETLTFPVPALILQPLVENAVSHGIAKREEGGHVRVTAARRGDQLTLTVEDNGPGLTASAEQSGGFGVGLANTRQRLGALYGEYGTDGLVLEPIDEKTGEGTRARLTLPRETREPI